jgi:hypothetical protein
MAFSFNAFKRDYALQDSAMLSSPQWIVIDKVLERVRPGALSVARKAKTSLQLICEDFTGHKIDYSHFCGFGKGQVPEKIGGDEWI